MDLHWWAQQQHVTCPAKSISPFFFWFPFRIAKIHTVRVRKPSSSELAVPICYAAVSLYFWRDLLKRKSHSLVTNIKISNIPTGFLIKEFSCIPTFLFLLSMYSKLFFFFFFLVWKCCILFMRPFWPIPTKSGGWSGRIWLCYNLLLVDHLQISAFFIWNF